MGPLCDSTQGVWSFFGSNWSRKGAIYDPAPGLTARASSGMRPGRYIGRWGRVSGSCGSRAAFSRFLNDVAPPRLVKNPPRGAGPAPRRGLNFDAGGQDFHAGRAKFPVARCGCPFGRSGNAPSQVGFFTAAGPSSPSSLVLTAPLFASLPSKSKSPRVVVDGF